MATVPNIEEWFANSNEALSINLLAPSKDGLLSVQTFHPKLTYQIFGEEERIFGYKGLKINLRYRANDMRPHLKISYSKKFKPNGEAEPEDITAILQEGNHLPKIAFAKESDFEESSKQQAEDWQPPGTLHEAFDGPDGRYEIWKGSLEDPAVKQLNSRVQILVPLYIEGGSYIGSKLDSDSAELDLSDADRWTLFFLYRKDEPTGDSGRSSYIFVGYSTIYRFYWFQPPTPPTSPKEDWELPAGTTELTELPCRTRLSQFVILPPFQGRGVGARLYNTIFAHYQKHAQTQEFTVEDPNEAFDDLRDVCDLKFLRSIPEFNDISIDTSVKLPRSGPMPHLTTKGDELEALQRKTKIASRQFYRVLEMHLMSKLPDSVRQTMDIKNVMPASTKTDRHQQRLWQLFAKQRLYRHNRDALSQMGQDERIEKLAEVLMSVELGYARLLDAYERSIKHSEAQTPQDGNGKRKLDEGAEPASKRARVEDA